MTDTLTLAIRRARYGKYAPRQDARARPAQCLATPPASETPPPPRVKLARSVLNGHPIGIVQHFVAAVYGVEVEDLVGHRRNHKFMLPRHVAIYVCSELFQTTSGEIGKRFNRDHSTVLHAIGRVGKMRQLDPKFGLKVQQLMDELSEVRPRRIMSGQQYSLEEKLAEVLRDLEHRRKVYPFRVTMKVMRREEADRRIAILEAVARDYREMLDDRDLEAMENDQGA